MARVLRPGAFGKWTDGRGWDRLWIATGREFGAGYGACADSQCVLVCVTSAHGVYFEVHEIRMQLFTRRVLC